MKIATVYCVDRKLELILADTCIFTIILYLLFQNTLST